MPTYNYICLGCNEKFVIFQNINDDPISDCQFCKDGKVERVISAGSGLIFKGSGFYLTDYKKNKSNKNKQTNKSKE